MIANSMSHWLALAVAVVANVAANTALKVAMSSVTGNSGKVAFLQLLSLGSFWIGLVFAGILLVSYLLALKSIPVSIAYVCVTSLAMVGLVIVEKGLFGVQVGPAKIAGILLVIAGVWLLSRTSQ